MREGYNEEEILAFESDKNTCTKLTLFFCDYAQKLINLQRQVQNQTHDLLY